MAAPPDPDEEAPVTCVCGRPLTDPVSRGRGLGPRCYKRLRARTAPRPGQLALDWDDQDDDEPGPYQPRPITDVPTGALL